MDRKSEYSELLRDPRWQRLRLQVFERDKWTCQKCGETTRTLAVHHKWYTRDKKPWEYDLDALVTVCEDCHQEEYKLRPAQESFLLESFRIANIWAADVYEFACAVIEARINCSSVHLPESAKQFDAFHIVLAAFSWCLHPKSGEAGHEAQQKLVDAFFADFERRHPQSQGQDK